MCFVYAYAWRGKGEGGVKCIPVVCCAFILRILQCNFHDDYSPKAFVLLFTFLLRTGPESVFFFLLAATSMTRFPRSFGAWSFENFHDVIISVLVIEVFVRGSYSAIFFRFWGEKSPDPQNWSLKPVLSYLKIFALLTETLMQSCSDSGLLMFHYLAF